MSDFNVTNRNILIPNAGMDYSNGNPSAISFTTAGQEMNLANVFANIPSAPAASAASAAPAAPSLPTAPVAVAADSIFGSVPVATPFGMPQTSAQGLKEMLDQGLITKEEYKNRLRTMYGFSSEGSSEGAVVTQADANNAVKELSSDELQKARTSNKGAYQVTTAHKEIAVQMVEGVKDILKKDPASVTEEELKKLEDVFSALRRNPMLSEAFVKEANNTTFKSEKGKTSTLLASYEQLLTEKKGRTIAKERISEVKSELAENVKDRNADEWKKFDEKSTKDVANVEVTFGSRLAEKAAKHPVSVGVVGLATAGVAAYGAKKSLGLIAKTGKYGLITAGALAVGYSLYNVAKND